MIEKIKEDIFRIEIPLPNNPLKFVNSYVIKASNQNLIIDTGMNREECMNVMRASLQELGVDLRKTNYFITHFHVDHLGLLSNLAMENSIIYFNQPDAERIKGIKFGTLWKGMLHFAHMNGFPENELREVIHNHPAYKYEFMGNIPFKILEDGDIIDIGRYSFKCIKTPGHSKGHTCLYEENRKIFIAGDHILNDITPIVQLRSDDENPLKEYLVSLDKVFELDIELVLPGHRDIFRNYRERIMELIHHHHRRAAEIISILGKGSQNAYQVASQMSWGITYESWDLFPVLQKWFSIGETTAHLKYLEENGMVHKEILEQKITYSLNKGSKFDQ